MFHSNEMRKRLATNHGHKHVQRNTSTICTHTAFCFLLSSMTHTHTHTDARVGCLGADCVRMISTISANCDVAFCALTVIIADFTDLHTTLPFSHLSALTHLQPVSSASHLYHTLQAILCLCVYVYICMCV